MARLTFLLVLAVSLCAVQQAHGRCMGPCPITGKPMAKPMAAVVLPAAAVPRPAFRTIAAAAEAGKLTTLVAAVKAAGGPLLEAVTSPSTAVTVFAPTDAAFAALLKKLNVTAAQLLADKATLNKVLSFHIVPTVARSSQLRNGQSLPTLLKGQSLTARVAGGKVSIVGGDVTANVVSPDLTAARSVVHVIDAVLVPK